MIKTKNKLRSTTTGIIAKKVFKSGSLVHKAIPVSFFQGKNSHRLASLLWRCPCYRGTDWINSDFSEVLEGVSGISIDFSTISWTHWQLKFWKPKPNLLLDFCQHSNENRSKESNDEEINLILATGSTRGNSDPRTSSVTCFCQSSMKYWSIYRYTKSTKTGTKPTSFPGFSLYREVKRGPWERGWCQAGKNARKPNDCWLLLWSWLVKKTWADWLDILPWSERQSTQLVRYCTGFTNLSLIEVVNTQSNETLNVFHLGFQKEN